ncbi:MAG: class I poly(R)-hydroxyalkanoic acid synthase [Pseudomonadota bacterium]
MTQTPVPQNDDDSLAERMTRLMERSQRVWAESLDRRVEDIGLFRPDPLHALPAMQKWMTYTMDHPQQAVEATLALWSAQAELWSRTLQRMAGETPEPLIEPEPGDKRFKDEAWSVNPVYDYLKQSYLLTGRWLRDQLSSTEGLTPQDRKKLELITRNYIEAMSPSNYAGTNPEVVKATLDQKGENLIRGLEHLIRDMERGHGHLLIQQTDLKAFKVGENMALSPGQVVFQNNVMQLIQFSPVTEEVHERPIVIISPWINKFYILDLNMKKSMIKWLVEQGHTVFITSWVNPGPAQANETWQSYMEQGAITAIYKALQETGADKANVVGYCIGGTLVGCALAHMANKGHDRVASCTFFTAQLDFSDAGELQAFVDEEVLEALGEAVDQQGYLAAENMFGAFNALRSSDLIWSFVVNNYLLGKENFPFDLLYWNSDSTAMPGRVHVYYLDTFYNKNALAKGDMVMDGEVLDMKKVKVPCYHVATVEDHIAPAQSAFRAAKMMGGRSQRFILGGSGHIAGVVNHPDLGKYHYWTKTGLKGDNLAEWQEGTTQTQGSWWPDWDKWLAKQSKKKVPAREAGATLGAIEPAPGSFVKVRADGK